MDKKNKQNTVQNDITSKLNMQFKNFRKNGRKLKRKTNLTNKSLNDYTKVKQKFLQKNGLKGKLQLNDHISHKSMNSKRNNHNNLSIEKSVNKLWQLAESQKHVGSLSSQIYDPKKKIEFLRNQKKLLDTQIHKVKQNLNQNKIIQTKLSNQDTIEQQFHKGLLSKIEENKIQKKLLKTMLELSQKHQNQLNSQEAQKYIIEYTQKTKMYSSYVYELERQKLNQNLDEIIQQQKKKLQQKF